MAACGSRQSFPCADRHSAVSPNSPMLLGPCRDISRSKEFAVSDRYQLQQLLYESRDSPSQRDKMLDWEQRYRQMLQKGDDLKFRKETIEKSLAQLRIRHNELCEELNLVHEKAQQRGWARYLTLEAHIRDDLYNLGQRERALQANHFVLRGEEADVILQLQTLERELATLRTSVARARPESAPRSRYTDYQAGAFRPKTTFSTGNATWDRAERAVPLRAPVRQQSAPQQSALPTVTAWKATEMQPEGSPSKMSTGSPMGSPTGAPLLPTVATETAVPSVRRDPIKERLEEHELQEVPVLGDGNCQFRALADQLAPNYTEKIYSQADHDRVRAAIVQQLCAEPDRYSPFVSEDYENYEAWVCRMAVDREWGNEVTLRAAADRFGVEIHVFADNLGEDQLYSAYEPSEKKISKLVRLVFRSVRGDSGHYNSVERLRR